ncbi:TPA: hypothetical protein N0F65_011127 [Lagenidium giganteum]|uniref:Uncharacterized protein n=1 Tax=Lagenidium giganteum TaxID=4803 RepID=A0AAV2ZIF4_9STRA|nr:TPA: hypothetical protein N0F65_011127 [Lagenidium giganteum]
MGVFVLKVHPRRTSAERAQHSPLLVRRPDHDIDLWVPFSWVRCLFSIFSLTLLITDIPRSGFGTINFEELYPTVAPNTVVNYGPYEYSVVRLSKNDSAQPVRASCDDEAMDLVPLWSYKYDTLSIPSRAMATHLNVSTYPRCVLYDGDCADDLAPDVAFTMLDDLVTSLKNNYFMAPAPRPPLEFFTQTNWIDRLHHIIYRWFDIVYLDLHTHHVHYYDITETQPVEMCQPFPRTSRRRLSARPKFCEFGIPWKMAHPLDLTASTRRRYDLHDHIAIRMALLRKAHPDLQFDLTVIFTHYTYTSAPKSTRTRVPLQAYFSAEDQEITTWIRGQHCDEHGAHCATVLFDDYRYERLYTENAADQLILLTAVLRGLAQFYMWLRVAFLWFGCFHARSEELKYRNVPFTKRFMVAWSTFFRIPAHVIIYGSWLPVLGYAVAHYIDCGLFHLLYYYMWSPSDGVAGLGFWEYVRALSVQMRNAWVLSMFVKLFVLFQGLMLQPRNGETTHLHGVLGIRGFVISTSSALSVFAQYRVPSFRDTNIMAMELLPQPAVGHHSRIARDLDMPTEFGFRYEVEILIASFSVVMTVAALWHLIVATKRCALRQRQSSLGVVFARSYYVPLSVQTLVPLTCMDVFWKTGRSQVETFSSELLSVLRHAKSSRRSRGSVMSTPRSVVSIGRLASMLTAFEHPDCRLCQQTKAAYWQQSQGCVPHEFILDVQARSPRVSSIIRLVNIALMSDPLELLHLSTGNYELFIVQLRRSATRVSRNPPSPYLPPLSLDAYAMYMTDSGRDTALVQSVRSCSLPWATLIECG